MDGLLMNRLYVWAISLIQSACLVIILYCSWLLLDTPLFALVAASVVLATTVYIETRMVVVDDAATSATE
jgi:hypothetical protein